MAAAGTALARAVGSGVANEINVPAVEMGEARQGQGAAPAKDPSQVKEWFYVGPHVMVVLPDSAKDALRGINQDLSNNEPYISLLSSAEVATPLWVIPVAKGGTRIKEVPAQ